MSKISTPDVVGLSSSVVSLGTIFATVAAIGVPIGVQRFIARNLSEGSIENVGIFMKSSLILVLLGTFVCSTLILISSGWIRDNYGYENGLIIITVGLVSSSAIMTLARSIVIAMMSARSLPLITIVSASVKIITGIVLVLLGTGALGVTLSFTLFPILASVFLTVVIINVLKRQKKSMKTLSSSELVTSQRDALRIVLAASLASWIPNLLHTLGSYLGPLVVFGAVSAEQAGTYFIAYSVHSAIAAIMSVLFAISYPVLSAMHDGRKRFSWRGIKISLILCVPLSASFFFYSSNIMGLFGQEYISASPSLKVLLISIIPYTIIMGITTLANSYGYYRLVLIIGLASNAPSVILYFVLVPLYDTSIGAAISYTAGSLFGLVVCVYLARVIGIQISYRVVTIVAILPFLTAFLLNFVHLNFVLGIFVTLIVSFSIFFRIGILNKNDIMDILSILPYNSTRRVLSFWSGLKRFTRRTRL